MLNVVVVKTSNNCPLKGGVLLLLALIDAILSQIV